MLQQPLPAFWAWRLVPLDPARGAGAERVPIAAARRFNRGGNNGVAVVIRRLLAVAWLLVQGAAGANAAGRLEVAAPDPARFPHVRLYLHPVDAAGRVVDALRPEQFRVLEDGRPAEIRAVQGGESGLLAVCLALDRSGSMGEGNKLPHAQLAARQFLAALRPGDLAAVISFADSALLNRSLTSDREQLAAAINGLRAGGETVLYDALYWAIDQVGLRLEGSSGIVMSASGPLDARRAVLAVTDGNDTASRTRPDEIVRVARSRGVPLYLIGLGRDVNRDLLGYLARETGGQFYLAPAASDLEHIYRQMAARFRTEYRITFRSPRPERDGTRRQLRIAIQGTDLPETTTWYQAPLQGAVVVATEPSGGTGAPLTGAPAAGSTLAGMALAVIALALVAGGAAWWWLSLRARRWGTEHPAAAALPLLYVDAPLVRLGRGAESDLPLESPRASRRHARIEVHGDRFWLVDEGSRNGTFVNGRRVRQTWLQPGDEVAFADCRFRFGGFTPPEAVPGADEPTLFAAEPPASPAGDASTASPTTPPEMGEPPRS